MAPVARDARPASAKRDQADRMVSARPMVAARELVSGRRGRAAAERRHPEWTGARAGWAGARAGAPAAQGSAALPMARPTAASALSDDRSRRSVPHRPATRHWVPRVESSAVSAARDTRNGGGVARRRTESSEAMPSRTRYRHVPACSPRLSDPGTGARASLRMRRAPPGGRHWRSSVPRGLQSPLEPLQRAAPRHSPG